MNNNTYSTNGIICPYCNHLHINDLYDMHGGEEDFDTYCRQCDREFRGSMCIHISYCTYQSQENEHALP